MSEMLLLGAGASVEAGIPDAYKMTEEILKRFNDENRHRLREYAKVLNFIIGGLLFDVGKRNFNPLTSGVNVEDLFNAVLLLSERNALEVSPFVGSWDSMIEAFDKVTPSPPRLDKLLKLIQQSVEKQVQHALSQNPTFSSSSDKIDKALENNFKKRIEAALKKSSVSMSSSESVGCAVADYIKEVSKKWSDNLKPNSSGSNSDLDKEFKQLVTQLEQKPAEGKKFKRTAEQMILMLKDLVWIEEATKVDYLNPILNKAKNAGRLVIATLNYDNGIELVAQANSVVCNTGIENWSQKGVFDFSNNGLHLIKLHGSIDWSWEEDVRTAERPMKHSIIRRVETEAFKTSIERPAVIFGQRNKLTADGPFLDLLRQFQNELENSNVLTVIGYSLRDAHINTYISKWLNESSDHKIRIVDPYFENSNVEYIRQLQGLRSTRPNQVEIVQKFTGEALKELYET
ncbi:MAG: SIR2 family protein [Pyrinomonadaceae bacterium]